MNVGLNQGAKNDLQRNKLYILFKETLDIVIIINHITLIMDTYKF